MRARNQKTLLKPTRVQIYLTPEIKYEMFTTPHYAELNFILTSETTGKKLTCVNLLAFFRAFDCILPLSGTPPAEEDFTMW